MKRKKRIPVAAPPNESEASVASDRIEGLAKNIREMRERLAILRKEESVREFLMLLHSVKMNKKLMRELIWLQGQRSLFEPTPLRS